LKKKILFISVALLLSPCLFSQPTGNTVTGFVIDKSSGQPVEFATVQLLRQYDSSAINTTVTDKKGRFIFNSLVSGNFIIRVSFIGYENNSIILTVNQQKQNVGNIEITTIAKKLSEVVVTGRKSLLNTNIDRKVYNVSGDIMAQSGSASDILKNIPSVEVDIDGQVLLRGSAGVMILINGKMSLLMGKSKADVLQQLPANSIERIEVITNPSAKYRPDGTSGIINIVLKKNIKYGWNGSLVTNAGNKDRYNSGINFNYRQSKWSFFSNYNFRQDSRLRTGSINREYFDSSGKTVSYYSENNTSPTRPSSNFITLGVDYTPNEYNSFGISGNYFRRKLTKNDVSQRLFYDKNYLLTEYFNRTKHDPEAEEEKDATVYWQHNFKEEDHEMRIAFNAATTHDRENNYNSNIYLLPLKAALLDNIFINDKDNQQELTIEYIKPSGEDAKIEAGYEGLFNQLDLNYYGEYYDTVQRSFIKDIIKSNQFTYNGAIHAAYAVFKQSFKKFGFSAGLRAEQVFIHGNLITRDSLISNRYLKIYPTLHLSYKIKENELQLNYSKRVNRPDGDELNPFPEYIDPYNLQAGNPKLLPEITHAAELGYKLQNEKYSFVPGLYYRYTKNRFTEITVPVNDSVLLTTQQNLSIAKSSGLELIFSAKPANFLSINLSSNFFYTEIDASNIGYNDKKSIISMSASFNSAITLTKSTLWQLSCNYRSARLTPQGKSFENVVLNTGLRQEVFKKKVSLTLTVSDIFKSLRQKSEFNSIYLNQRSLGKRDSGVFYLGFSYRFGKIIKKSNEEKLQFDDSL
jgi:outer membrane receptor protein involved in Fe transport